MLSPEWVSRVMPPIATIRKTITAPVASQMVKTFFWNLDNSTAQKYSAKILGEQLNQKIIPTYRVGISLKILGKEILGVEI